MTEQATTKVVAESVVTKKTSTHVVPRLGVGLQFNPELMGWFPFFAQPIDVLEVLLDNAMSPIDGPGLFWPGSRKAFERAAATFPLIGHSNYAGDFGFGPLETTVAARRHAPIAKLLGMPSVSNHCFYSDDSWADVWPSAVQFSRAEIPRIAERAKRLQDIYGVPLGHENAAYYRSTPGSEMPEEEFLAEVLEQSGTYLHLDIHNLYSNGVNHGAAGYSVDRFLATIPLDRVISIHMAGGRSFGGYYQDSHDTGVPEAAWELLARVLSQTTPGAVILEYESRGLYDGAIKVGRERSIEIVQRDVERAKAIWDAAYGHGSRWSTRNDRPLRQASTGR